MKKYKNNLQKYDSGGDLGLLNRAYYMTLDEYLEKVAPLLKEFKQFLKKNNYFIHVGYGTLDVISYPELVKLKNEGGRIGHQFNFSSVRDKYARPVDEELKYQWNYYATPAGASKDAPQDLIDKKNEYYQKLINLFNGKLTSDADLLKSNKRIIKHAIDYNFYKNDLEKNIVDISLIEKVAESAGVKLPKKLYDPKVIKQKEAEKKYEKIYQTLPQINKDALAGMIEEIKLHTKPLEEDIYEKEFDRYTGLIERYLKTEALEKRVLIHNIPFYDKIFNIGKTYTERKEEIVPVRGFNRTRTIIHETIFVQDLTTKNGYENVLNEEILSFIEGLKTQMFSTILKNFDRITKKITSIANISLEYNKNKGAIQGEWRFTFDDGSSFDFKTQAIGAGGYNIQTYHFRYISDFTNVKLADGSSPSSNGYYNMSALFSSNDGNELKKYKKGGITNELKKGIQSEKEHTATIKKIANGQVSIFDAPKYIALDHLKELPDYYTRLQKMENSGRKFADGGELDIITKSDKMYSSSSRFKPSEIIVFDPPIIGPNGNKLTAYKWAYEWIEDFDFHIGETVSKRQSDWNQAESSAETGKDLVHQFSVELKDGKTITVSSESVPSTLGYTSKAEMSKFPSLVNSLKTLAKNKMKLAILEAQMLEYENALNEIEKLPRPEIVKNNDKEGFAKIRDVDYETQYKMGDVDYIQEGKFDFSTGKYISDNVLNKETIDNLNNAWVLKRIREAGIKKPFGIEELKKSIKIQEQKINKITNSELKTTEENKFADGGTVDSNNYMDPSYLKVKYTDIIADIANECNRYGSRNDWALNQDTESPIEVKDGEDGYRYVINNYKTWYACRILKKSVKIINVDLKKNQKPIESPKHVYISKSPLKHINKSDLSVFKKIVLKDDEDKRPALKGVYFDASAQLIVALDGNKMVAIRENIDKNELINPFTNKTIDAKYPDYISVLPLTTTLTKNVDLETLVEFLSKLKKLNKGIKYDVNKHHFIFKIDDNLLYFDVDSLLDAVKCLVKLGYSRSDIGINERHGSIMFLTQDSLTFCLVMAQVEKKNYNELSMDERKALTIDIFEYKTIEQMTPQVQHIGVLQLAKLVISDSETTRILERLKAFENDGITDMLKEEAKNLLDAIKEVRLKADILIDIIGYPDLTIVAKNALNERLNKLENKALSIL